MRVTRVLPIDSPAYTFGHASEDDLQRAWAATYGVGVIAPGSE